MPCLRPPCHRRPRCVHGPDPAGVSTCHGSRRPIRIARCMRRVSLLPERHVLRDHGWLARSAADPTHPVVRRAFAERVAAAAHGALARGVRIYGRRAFQGRAGPLLQPELGLWRDTPAVPLRGTLQGAVRRSEAHVAAIPPPPAALARSSERRFAGGRALHRAIAVFPPPLARDGGGCGVRPPRWHSPRHGRRLLVVLVPGLACLRAAL